MWIAALPLFLRPDRRDVFPSIAMTPSGIPVIDATQAAKQLWNCPASSTARMSPSEYGVPCGAVCAARDGLHAYREGRFVGSGQAHNASSTG
jgi:hypothetical protein